MRCDGLEKGLATSATLKYNTKARGKDEGWAATIKGQVGGRTARAKGNWNTRKYTWQQEEATTRNIQNEDNMWPCYLIYSGIILASSANRVLVLSAT